jgi:hypothetical protein
MTNLTPPRYLVIADYPNSPFNVGNILTQYTQFNKTSYWVNDNLYTDRHPEDYPHLFRLLHWWEFRDESEMPEYVKSSKWVAKIRSYDLSKGTFVADGEVESSALQAFNPATLNEYNEYIKNK